MGRPAKRYTRSFCRGLALPLSYRLPCEVREWLRSKLAITGDGYHDMLANPVDVEIIWRWDSWDVETIQRRRCVSRRYASNLFDYAVMLDKYLCGYMAALDSGRVVWDVSDCVEWEPCTHGLRMDRPSVELWERDECDESNMYRHRISREALRAVLDKL